MSCSSIAKQEILCYNVQYSEITKGGIYFDVKTAEIHHSHITTGFFK
jgi:hypothetical protein